MCVAASLADMHASVRRDAPVRATQTTPSALQVNAVAVSATPDARGAVVPSRSGYTAGKTHVDRTPARRARAARADAGFRAHSREEVKALIRVYAAAHGIDASLPLAIAHCESGFKWNAANGRSSARGVFQYLSGTWRRTPAGRKGTSVFDTEAHIRTAVAHIATLGTAAWNASRACWTNVARAEAEDESAPDSTAAPEAESALPVAPETENVTPLEP